MTAAHLPARVIRWTRAATVIAFFESEDGLAFLHRLVLALEFALRFVAGCGRRLVPAVVRLAGLAPSVATITAS